jgi:hypothetical protein
MFGSEVVVSSLTSHTELMKVKDLIKYLSEIDPEDSICALVYDKRQFDFPDDDDMILTNEGWEKLCADFDEQTFDDIYESLHMGALDYADTK